MTDLRILPAAPRVQYLAPGDRADFAYGFPIFAADDLAVSLDGLRQGGGFVVHGAGREGGQVVFDAPPPAGTVVTLERRLVIQRVSDFQEGGAFTARALNRELDYLTACAQQLANDGDLALRIEPADRGADLRLPDRAARAGKALAFDGTGAVALVPHGSTVGLPSVQAAGAGAVARGVPERLRDRVSVCDYGAAGDGVADDSQAFAAALAAARGVDVPEGVYLIASTVAVPVGRSLTGRGGGSVLRAAGTGTIVVELPAGEAALSALRIEGGAIGVLLRGRTGPCIGNRLTDLTVADAATGVVLDGYQAPANPCAQNVLTRIAVLRPTLDGFRLQRSGAGDPPRGNRLIACRVASGGAATTGSAYHVASGRRLNAFLHCEADLAAGAHSGFRIGADAQKTHLADCGVEGSGPVAAVALEAGSGDTAILNLDSRTAGAAIADSSGGAYVAFNAGFPVRTRLHDAYATALTVAALRHETQFVEPPAGGLAAVDARRPLYLVSAFGGPTELRLPAAGAVPGAVVTVKKTDTSANPVTVTEADGPGPDGAPVQLASRYDFVALVSNGAGWWVTAGNAVPLNTLYVSTPGLHLADAGRRLLVVSAFSGPVEIRLPAPGESRAVGRLVTIKKADPSAHAVTVTQVGGGGPDAAAQSLTVQFSHLTVLSNGAAWHIVGRD